MLNMPKMIVMEKNGNVIFLAWITIRPFSAVLKSVTYDSFRAVSTQICSWILYFQRFVRTLIIEFLSHYFSLLRVQYYQELLCIFRPFCAGCWRGLRPGPVWVLLPIPPLCRPTGACRCQPTERVEAGKTWAVRSNQITSKYVLVSKLLHVNKLATSF